MKLPSFFQPIIFGALLSGLMSFAVSGIATWNAIGFIPTFMTDWITSWLFAWAVAFPAVLVIAPLVRRLTGMLVEQPMSPSRPTKSSS